MQPVALWATVSSIQCLYGLNLLQYFFVSADTIHVYMEYKPHIQKISESPHRSHI